MKRIYVLSIERSDVTGKKLEVNQYKFNSLREANITANGHAGDKLVRTWIVKQAELDKN